MNLIGTALAVESPAFQRRVRVASFLTALDIINNPNEVGGKRVAAGEVVARPEQNQFLSRFVWFTAANPTVAASVDAEGNVNASDGDIMYVIAGAWAMIFPPDPPDPADLVPTPKPPADHAGPAPLADVEDLPVVAPKGSPAKYPALD